MKPSREVHIGRSRDALVGARKAHHVCDVGGGTGSSMPVNSRVLVIEGVIPEHSHYNFSKASDLLMLVYSDSGRERTKEEFDSLFTRAGFRVKPGSETAVIVTNLRAGESRGVIHARDPWVAWSGWNSHFQPRLEWVRTLPRGVVVRIYSLWG